MKKLSAIILSLVIAFSVTACSSGNNEESKPVESKIAETETTESVNIKENMDSVLEHKKFEGIVYLTKDNSVIYQSATGKDEKGNDLKVDSIMYIGSISKQFCSAAILMLRDQGKLSLDNTLDT